MPVDYQKLRECTTELAKTLDYMEKHMLSKNKFVAGDDITLADLLCISEVMQAMASGYDITKGRPKVAAWVESVKAKLGTVFVDAHKSLMDLTKKKPYMEKVIGF